jgi:predicted dinucleotide-utilizing enzyme/RNA polymerase subunit RPABC4/transcription elongation factor Spt4
MDTLYGIIGLAIFLGIGYLIQKGMSAARKAANKNILYRSEYKEQHQFVSEPLTFKTTASVPEIMHELETYVETAEDHSKLKAVFYQLSRDEGHISYAFGNMLDPKLILATIMFTKSDETTVCTYKIQRWQERDGMICSMDAMKKLRKQVKAAFKAAYDATRIKGAPLNDYYTLEQNEVQKDQKPQKTSQEMFQCSKCGSSVGQDDEFCMTCGNKIVKTKRCKLCGSLLLENTSFCGTCGEKI